MDANYDCCEKVAQLLLHQGKYWKQNFFTELTILITVYNPPLRDLSCLFFYGWASHYNYDIINKAIEVSIILVPLKEKYTKFSSP